MSQQEEVQLFWSRTVGSIDMVLTCLEKAPVDKWNWKPVESANSLFALANHVVGSTEEHIVEGIFSEPVGRDRPGEFASQGTDASSVRAKWIKVQTRIDDLLPTLQEGALEEMCVDPRLGERSVREILLIVAQHVAEHVGHCELTLDILLDE